MSPAGKRLILILTVLVVLLGGARLLSGGRDRSGSHFGWVESGGRPNDAEGGSSADADTRPAGALPGGVGTVGGAPASDPAAGSAAAVSVSSHEASPAPPAAPAAEGRPGDEDAASPVGAGTGKATPSEDEHDAADSRGAEHEPASGRNNAGAEQANTQVDAGDLSSATIRVLISSISGLLGQEDAQLTRAENGFYLHYTCQAGIGRSRANPCPCPLVEKPVDDAQVTEFLHFAQSEPVRMSDSPRYTIELSLRDGSSRSFRGTVGLSPLVGLFDIRCQ